MELHEALTAAVSKAIAEVVPVELQRSIFSEALTKQLEQATKGDNSALVRAVNNHVHTMMLEILQEPEQQARIRSVLLAAFEATLANGALVQRVAQKIADTQRW
jgi:hypothetical protein